jgi:hypothetical protein
MTFRPTVKYLIMVLQDMVRMDILYTDQNYEMFATKTNKSYDLKKMSELFSKSAHLKTLNILSDNTLSSASIGLAFSDLSKYLVSSSDARDMPAFKAAFEA